MFKHELPARKALASYAGTLQEDRRVLLDRYALQDIAFKVFKMPTWPVHHEGATPTLRPAPQLGQHTDHVLGDWLGLKTEEIGHFARRAGHLNSKPPLRRGD
jgi:crotonobetainyl-CoA:carnitine CoA-transferase CaiB-like acyl-CoA transferase